MDPIYLPFFYNPPPPPPRQWAVHPDQGCAYTFHIREDAERAGRAYGAPFTICDRTGIDFRVRCRDGWLRLAPRPGVT